ncbi:hypothetical protein CANMA_002673 [Candida margitis]|uniref:uncharacterized protein n=1 Tax=Candida margitis TaxID=1775924 RepID=UPI002226A45D|nr:uncharacterized protein CANMA_002673 [Candida margitis]KAI5967905.1 hypothetical protein CANMA_002673 [Candida margitis]
MAKVRKFFDKLIIEPRTRSTKEDSGTLNYNPYIDQPNLCRHSQPSLNGKGKKKNTGGKRKSSSLSLHNGSMTTHNDDGTHVTDLDQESLTTSSKPYSSLRSASPPVSPKHSIRQNFTNAYKIKQERGSTANGTKQSISNNNSKSLPPPPPPPPESMPLFELSPVGSASSITSSFNLPTVAQHDGFYSLVKVDKFKFSHRGTLLNFKTRHGAVNGSDIYVCDEKGRKIRKRRSRRKRRSVRQRLSLSSCSLREGDEMNDNVVVGASSGGKVVGRIGSTRNGTVMKDDASFVSIATTATSATSMTTSINGTNGANGNVARSLATKTAPVRNGNTMAKPKPTRNGATTTKHTKPTTTTKRIINGGADSTTHAITTTPHNSPVLFGSQFDPCFNANKFRVNIIPDMASYQPSFLQKRNSLRTLESRVATPNIATNTTTKGRNGIKAPTASQATSSTSLAEDDAKSTTTTSFHHQEVEFGNKFTCVIEEGLKSSSLSEHASIRDIKIEYGLGGGSTKTKGQGNGTSDGAGTSAGAHAQTFDYDADATDLQSSVSMQLSRFTVDCGDFEEKVPLLSTKKGKGFANGVVSNDAINGAATQFQGNEKYDNKWIIQVKDRLHYYYNSKLTKLRRIKLQHHQKNKEQGEAAGAMRENKDGGARSTPSGFVGPSIDVPTPTTTSNASTLNLQSGLYSHENKRSSKINVVDKTTPREIVNGGKHDQLNVVASPTLVVDSDGFYVADETGEGKDEDDLTGAIYFIKNDNENAETSIAKDGSTRSPSMRISKLLYYHRQQLQRQFKFAPSSFARAKNTVDVAVEEEAEGGAETTKALSTSGGLLLQNMYMEESMANKTMMVVMRQSQKESSQLIELQSPCEVDESSSSNDGDDEQSFRGCFENDVASSIASLSQ